MCKSKKGLSLQTNYQVVRHFSNVYDAKHFPSRSAQVRRCPIINPDLNVMSWDTTEGIPSTEIPESRHHYGGDAGRALTKVVSYFICTLNRISTLGKEGHYFESGQFWWGLWYDLLSLIWDCHIFWPWLSRPCFCCTTNYTDFELSTPRNVFSKNDGKYLKPCSGPYDIYWALTIIIIIKIRKKMWRCYINSCISFVAYTGIRSRKCYVVSRVVRSRRLTLEFTLNGEIFFETMYDVPVPICFQLHKVHTKKGSSGVLKSVTPVTKKPRIYFGERSEIDRFIRPFVPNQSRYGKRDCLSRHCVVLLILYSKSILCKWI